MQLGACHQLRVRREHGSLTDGRGCWPKKSTGVNSQRCSLKKRPDLRVLFTSGLYRPERRTRQRFGGKLSLPSEPYTRANLAKGARGAGGLANIGNGPVGGEIQTQAGEIHEESCRD